MDFMTGRSHTCGELRAEDEGKTIRLSGWVNVLRDKGGVIFLDMRDRYGITQLVMEQGVTEEFVIEEARTLKSESSFTIDGQVRKRRDPNDEIPTGQVEVTVNNIQIHNISPTLPFEIASGREVNSEIRMKWRFLDLRRPNIKHKLLFRHAITNAIREHFNQENFIDVETPILFKSTPEGARDYVVPSRINSGHFYALPQSPQTLKQSLMSAGIDKYFQIVRCFRDEDLRGDRQPEFTQLDMEMSFITREDVFKTIEGCFEKIFKDVMKQDLTTPFERLTFQDVLERYGHDAPDLRFGCEHRNFNEVFADSTFKVISNALEKGGDLRMMAVPSGSTLSRKQLDALTEIAKNNGAGGLLWAKYNDDAFTGPVSKFLGDKEKSALIETFSLKSGDLILGVADSKKIAASALHKVRLEVGQLLDLIDKNSFRFAWIIDFPLFEETDDGQITYNHHPFCFPHPEDRQYFDSDPLKVRAWSYDLILNGWELGSGSIRNHELDLQKKILTKIGVNEEQQESQFGFLFRALEYGAPPHGGIALGIDRVVTLLDKGNDIREYIAFPKTHSGTDLFSECPSPITEQQLQELSLNIVAEKKEVE